MKTRSILRIRPLCALLVGAGLLSGAVAWAGKPVTLTFADANGSAACDVLKLTEEADGFVRGRQIAPNCASGDYLVTGRFDNANGLVLYSAAMDAGVGNMTQVVLKGGGSVAGLQLNGANAPTPSLLWNGRTWAVQKTTPTITFSAAPNITLGGASGTVSASSDGSNRAFVYASNTPSVCTVNSTGVVTGLAAGACIVSASQTATFRDNAAVQTLSLTLNALPQAISFGSYPTINVGGTGTVSASGGNSGSPITYASATPSICTVDSNGVVTGIAPGTCTITADQAGNAVYSAAAQASTSFAVNAVAAPASSQSTFAVLASDARKAEGNPAANGTPSSTPFTFTVNRTGNTTSAVSLSWAVTGSGANPADAADFIDGVLPTGTVSFAPGQSTATITVNVAGDANPESDEEFTVTLASNVATMLSESASGNYGANGVNEKLYKIAGAGGAFTLNYDMQNIPDQADIYVNSTLVATTPTGMYCQRRLPSDPPAAVCGSGTLSAPSTVVLKAGDVVKVVITSTNQNTAWSYAVNYSGGVQAVIVSPTATIVNDDSGLPASPSTPVNVAAATPSQFVGNYRMSDTQGQVQDYTFTLNADGSCIETNTVTGKQLQSCNWSYDNSKQVFSYFNSAGADGGGRVTGTTAQFTLTGHWSDGSPKTVIFTRQP